MLLWFGDGVVSCVWGVTVLVRLLGLSARFVYILDTQAPCTRVGCPVAGRGRAAGGAERGQRGGRGRRRRRGGGAPERGCGAQRCGGALSCRLLCTFFPPVV